MECQIRKHDDRQFEVKVAYPLERGAAEDRYELDLFVFLPYQLGVNASTYSPAQFYEDLRSYTRFKTPALSLDEVNDARNELSPLTRVEQHVESGRRTGRWDERRLHYELRVLANVVVARVRERTLGILQRRSRPRLACRSRRRRRVRRQAAGGTWDHAAENPRTAPGSPGRFHSACAARSATSSWTNTSASRSRVLTFVSSNSCRRHGETRSAEEEAQLAAAIRGESRHRARMRLPVARLARREGERTLPLSPRVAQEVLRERAFPVRGTDTRARTRAASALCRCGGAGDDLCGRGRVAGGPFLSAEHVRIRRGRHHRVRVQGPNQGLPAGLRRAAAPGVDERPKHPA